MIHTSLDVISELCFLPTICSIMCHGFVVLSQDFPKIAIFFAFLWGWIHNLVTLWKYVNKNNVLTLFCCTLFGLLIYKGLPNCWFKPTETRKILHYLESFYPKTTKPWDNSAYGTKKTKAPKLRLEHSTI